MYFWEGILQCHIFLWGKKHREGDFTVKVYVRAFLYANLGDDLFIQMLSSRYPDVEFTVVVNSEYSKIYEKRNVKSIGLNKLQRGIHKVVCKRFGINSIQEKIERESDICVIIGGSMFQELAGDSSAIERLRSFPGKYRPVYILGINFGPYRTEEYLNSVRNLLGYAVDVCFRDSYSYAFFRENMNVRWARDILFSIETLIPNNKRSKNYIVVSIMDFSRKSNLKLYEYSYIQFLVKSIRYFMGIGSEIRIVSFCKFEGDENAAEKIYAEFSLQEQEAIEICKYNGNNWLEIVELIRDAKYVIASRFHSMILGFAYEIPTLPILYNEKCVHVLEDLDLYGKGISLDYLEEAYPNLDMFIRVKNIEEIKKQSTKQFKGLDAVLGVQR